LIHSGVALTLLDTREQLRQVQRVPVPVAGVVVGGGQRAQPLTVNLQELPLQRGVLAVTDLVRRVLLRLGVEHELLPSAGAADPARGEIFGGPEIEDLAAWMPVTVGSDILAKRVVEEADKAGWRPRR